eukprot:6472872-Amphidinium_carterae.1
MDWTREEIPGDKFEPRKRKANEQGEAEPTQVSDLKKENAQLGRQLEVLTSTIEELKEKLIRMNVAMTASAQVSKDEVVTVPEAPAPMDDGANVIEILTRSSYLPLGPPKTPKK